MHEEERFSHNDPRLGRGAAPRLREICCRGAASKGKDRIHNVGEVHRALALDNRVPLVCAALGSKKFLNEHGLRILSKTGPPSGQSTTVIFTYEIVEPKSQKRFPEEAWQSLRGIAKEFMHRLGVEKPISGRSAQIFMGPAETP
jgi:hypothetical protein